MRIQILLRILLLLLWAGVCEGQEMGNFFVKSYLPKEYQAATQNWDIVQDSSGMMYFANNEGVLQFDGTYWRVFPTTNKSTVRAVAIDKQGIIYAGGINEFGYLQPNETGKLEYVSISAKLSKEDKKFGDVWRTVSTHEGVYFQSANSLFRWANGKIKVWKSKTRFQLVTYVLDRLFVKEVENPLREMVNDKLVDFRELSLFEKEGLVNLVPYEGSKVLFCGIKSSFQLLDLNPNVNKEQVVSKFSTEIDSALVKHGAYAFAKQPNGNFVMSTRKGGSFIIDKNGKLLYKLQKAEGMHSESHYINYTDKQNNLWIGTNNGIIYTEINTPATIFTDKRGLEGTVYCITRIEDTLYAGTSLGIFYLDKTTNNFKKIEGFSFQVWDIKPMKIGNETKIIFAAAGVYELKNGKPLQISPNSSFVVYPSLVNPLRLYCSGRDYIAALLYKNGKWEEEGHLKMKGDDIRSIIEDKNDQLWASVNLNGVRKFTLNGNKFDSTATMVKYDTSQNITLKENKFFKIGGEILVATEKGIKQYNPKGNNFVPYTKFGFQFGDDSYAITNLLEDNKRNVWICAIKGKQYLLGVAEYQNDGSYQWNSTPYYRIPTMSDVAFWADPQEVLWFGGSEGLFRFDGKIKKNYNQIPATQLRKVSLPNDSTIFYGTDSQLLTKNIHAKGIVYQYNTILFEYSLPYYDLPEKNLYSHKLQGFDENWSSWTKESKKEYTNLPAGNYVFRVKSKNIYEVEGREATYQFKILPPWYQTWWAYLVYVGVSGLVVWQIVKFNTKRLQAQNAALEKTVLLRTAEIEAKKQEIENSYENVQVLSEIGKQITASLDLDKVLTTLYENVNELMDATVFGIGLYDEAKQQIYYRLAIENGVRYTPFSRTMADKNQFPVWCIEQKSDVLIADVFAEYQNYISKYHDDEDKVSLEDGSQTSKVYAMLYTPIFANEKVIGVITVQSYKRNAYQPYHLNLLKSLAVYTQIALNNADTFHEIELQKQEIIASINYAKRIQNAMLPTTETLNELLGASNYFVLFKPRDIVSGDFYWCKEVNGKLLFAVADCTGHGVPGAFVSMVGNATLNEITKRGLSHPHLILNKLNKEITTFFNQNMALPTNENQTNDHLKVQDGMDICLISIDKTNQKINYAGAMNPLYYVQAGELKEIKADKKAIGGSKKTENSMEFMSHEIDYALPETLQGFQNLARFTLYLVSDGYQDQFGGSQNKKFMTKKLRELLHQNHHLSMAEQVAELDKTFMNWQGEQEQVDDVTVVGLKL